MPGKTLFRNGQFFLKRGNRTSDCFRIAVSLGCSVDLPELRAVNTIVMSTLDHSAD